MTTVEKTTDEQITDDQTTAKQAAAVPPPANSFEMIRTLTVVALLSGLLIVLAYKTTLPRITHNKREALKRAVNEVIPGPPASRATFEIGEEGLTRLDADATPDPKKAYAYAGYDESGQFIAVALEASGQGYQDVIKILYGYSPERNTITGMYVLESKETPGLGDKISKDEDFVGNFDALDVTLNADKTALANPIIYVKNGTKANAWEIDGITGATISSKAIGRLLNKSAGRLIPFIAEHLEHLENTE